MRCCGFTHNISSIRNRNTAGITFFICKDFCCTIFSDHYRFCRIKIIASILFYFQGGCQISSESCTFQYVCVGFSIVCCFDNLEWLFHHLLQRQTLTIYFCYKISLIIADQIMFFLICQITGWRSDLFHIIIAKI